jgi:dienelactone hydrolase
MAELVLFHHALGLTPGVIAFADRLRAGGHRVRTPDLYEGRTFATVEAGVAHVREAGFGEIIRRGVAAAETAPQATVFGGFSLGVLPAQKLAQTRPGALGALLYHAAVPVSEFSPAWPTGVALQMHHGENDTWGDLEHAQALAATVPGAQLRLYPGSAHLVTDSSFSDYDPVIADAIVEQSLAFLSQWP